MRAEGSPHISQAGIDLARRIGGETGRFGRVATSTAPRAFETAIAMGLAVDEQMELLRELGPGVEAEVRWDAGFAAFGRALRQGGATARFGTALAALWRAFIEAVPEGGRALMITHGGIVECGAVACLPEADHAAWGPACGYCEGVRLAFDGEKFVAAEIRRVEPSRYEALQLGIHWGISHPE